MECIYYPSIYHVSLNFLSGDQAAQTINYAKSAFFKISNGIFLGEKSAEARLAI